MAKDKKVTTANRKPSGGFTQIYNSFLDTDILNQYEKLVFIVIKSFANNTTKQSYPSLSTISEISGISLSQVRRSIDKLKKLGILDVERRKSEKYGNIQNLYTIHDDPEIWSIRTTELDDMAAVAQEISDAKLIAELKSRGYEVTKSIKKESASGTDQSSDVDTFTDQYSKNNDSITNKGSQERYSLEDLKQYFNYDYMLEMNPLDQRMIDYLMQIIYDTVNTNEDTLRVQRTDRPIGVVISQLMKLTYDEIIYVIHKFKAQTDRIEHPKAYLLTQLYEAKGQFDADITNQVSHDMYGGGSGNNGIV